MTKSVSNPEIEDMLSSIRRLVSDQPAPKAETADGAKIERLVLTPNFRVDEFAEPQGDQASSEPSEQAQGTPAPQDIDDGLEQAGLEIAEDSGLDVSDEPAREAEKIAPFVLEQPTAIEPSPEADVEAQPNVPVHVEEDTIEAAVDPAPEPLVEAAEQTGLDPVVPAEFEAQAEWSDEKLEGVDGPETEEGISLEVVAEPEAADELVDPADMSLEERIAELEAAIQHSPQEWEPDGSEDGSDDETRPISADLAEADPSEDDQAHDANAVSDDQPAAFQEDTGFDPESLDLELNVEEVVPEEALGLATESVDADAPFGDTDIGDAQETAEPEVEQPVHMDMTVELRSVPIVEDVTPEIVAEDTQPPEIQIDPEPEVSETEDEAAPVTELDWAGDDEDVAPEIDFATFSADQTSDVEENLMAEEDLALDEEALRELVAEVVREELQGALGEKITRNVRRMIRREIQRAFAVRELE